MRLGRSTSRRRDGQKRKAQKICRGLSETASFGESAVTSLKPLHRNQPAGNSENNELRDGHNEAAAPGVDRGHLVHDFLGEVPWQDEQEIRLRLEHRIRRENGDVR